MQSSLFLSGLFLSFQTTGFVTQQLQMNIAECFMEGTIICSAAKMPNLKKVLEKTSSSFKARSQKA